jgi:ATP-binding cassette subfamily B protein
MAERGHLIYRVRSLPNLGGQLLRSIFELVLTTLGIIWLDESVAWIAITAAMISLVLPLLAQPALAERDLRLKSHSGALSRFYLDALLGLVPIRVHGAERALRREHESLLVGWAEAGLGLQRFVVRIEGVQYVLGFGIAGWLLLTHVSHTESGSVLLLIYWTLNLPVIGEQIAQLAWQYPAHRNLTLRLFEPLGAGQHPNEADAQPPAPVKACNLGAATQGVTIALETVSVRAAGHIILEDINLNIGPGTHVAIVGQSGAGKSSLVGVLLGWFRPATGRVLIDGGSLDAAGLERLRAQTAWVDPAVQLWNRSLFDNLRYGTGDVLPTTELLEQSGLRSVLQKLPDGLQTQLGESGALVSGGEGQRVRLARAMLKCNVRLAILDEPFRGLDRPQRRELLANAREHWRDATLLCVTHDVGETLAFPRVIVVEAGQIVEDGAPTELAANPDSRYRAMLYAEDSVREELWASQTWRHLRLEGGRLVEETGRVAV